MISSVLILSASNQIIIKKDFTNNVPMEAVHLFIETIMSATASELKSPILRIENYKFHYIVVNSLTFISISQLDILSSLVYQFLYSLVTLIQNYTTEISTSKLIKQRALLLEVLDEIVDFGTPQLVNQELISPFILYGKPQKEAEFLYNAKVFTEESTRSNVIRHNTKLHKHPEAFISVEEKLKFHYDAEGTLVSKDVSGLCRCEIKILGNPQCLLKLNKKTIHGSSTESSFNLKFHSCVNLDTYKKGNQIKFTPPEKSFNVLEYASENIRASPFDVVVSRMVEGPGRVIYFMKIGALFSSLYSAKNITVMFPVPKNTSKIESNPVNGVCKYKPAKDFIQWKVHKLKGQNWTVCKTTVTVPDLDAKELAKDTRKVTMEVNIPYYTQSDFIVDGLDILGAEMNALKKWVSYNTKNCVLTYDLK
eukprot:GAHX01000918.1.p1 GENE.GAHX01000918.1~~GAHX01000918.1.p1  ORF type:complete len:422 (-),score=72.81 GAHX01000918.1:32-1297(-)